MGDKSQLTVLDRIQGSSFLVIRSVMPVFQRRNLDVQLYKIGLLHEGQSNVVLFSRIHEGNEAVPKDLGILEGADSELSSGDLRSYLSKLSQMKTADAIQGKSFFAIQAADSVFQKRLNTDLSRYNITLVREENSVFVTFTDKEGKPGARGGPGTLPAFEVELAARDLQVLRSNFVR